MPFGVKAMALTICLWPTHWPSSLPVVKSQTRRMVSKWALARRFPSLETAMSSTLPACASERFDLEAAAQVPAGGTV